MLINKHPHKTVECDFNLFINDAVLSRTDNVKYLGVYLDDKLKWTPYIKHLSLQLARYSGLFYHIRNFVSNHILLMLYYSLVYSRIQYQRWSPQGRRWPRGHIFKSLGSKLKFLALASNPIQVLENVLSSA